MNQELIAKFITPLGLQAENIVWKDTTVLHEGRGAVIQLPEYIPLDKDGAVRRGAKSSEDKLAINNLEFYTTAAVDEVKTQIDAKIAEEKNQLKNLRSEYEAKFAAIAESKKTKVQWLNRFVAKKTIILLSLATLFNMLMCTININHFFGETFTEIMNQGMSWLCVVLMALLIALSTPYFALLKNQQMVNKTIWILPLDMVVAYIYSHGEMFSPDFIWWFKLVSIGLYTFILGVIIWSIMEVMIGKGITDKKEHYENITSALLVD